ncbi:MAG: hypothetical protein ACRBCI_04520 [Cellvibrionaceae bacterium]
MKEIKYNNLRMVATASDGEYSMALAVASGFADFVVTVAIDQRDFDVISKDEERTAFLCAAFHHPFQLKKTALNEAEQRHYLDVILHASASDVENFLTEKDHSDANGAISNFVKITTEREQYLMRKGKWFE